MINAPQFNQLRSDFEYNLVLLEERDAELQQYDASAAVQAAQLMDSQRQAAELQAAYQEAVAGEGDGWAGRWVKRQPQDRKLSKGGFWKSLCLLQNLGLVWFGAVMQPLGLPLVLRLNQKTLTLLAVLAQS